MSAGAHWRGDELVHRDDWCHRLSDAEVADLEAALTHAKATGRPREALARDDFRLPVLRPALARWLEALHDGYGFLNVRGFPVDRWSLDDTALAYWGLGLHLGTPVSQNAAGDTLGHVLDTGADPANPAVRLYKTRVELGFHSDGSDLVGLLCLRQGRSGGALRLVSTAALYAEIERRRPDLVPLLFEPFHWDRNDEQGPGESPFFSLPICRREGGRIIFFYIGWYIRGAQRHPEVPRLTAEQHALLDLVDAIAAEPGMYLETRLEPGELNILKNNAVLHARTAFQDFAEPARKRHLLRLWLTAHGEWADGDAFVRQGIPRKAGVTSDREVVASAVREERS